MARMPAHAVVLAAGLGTRLRPLTDAMPKPLLNVGGKTLIDHALDRLVLAGVGHAVVNVHYLADQVIAHLGRRRDIGVTISDERTQLLETGGGTVKALSMLGAVETFITINSDMVTVDRAGDSLKQMAALFDPDKMDALMQLIPRERAMGHGGSGDFLMDADGRLTRKPKGGAAPYVWIGTQIAHSRLYAGYETGVAFSQNVAWDRALEAGRLYGVVHDGDWIDITTLKGFEAAEAYFRLRA